MFDRIFQTRMEGEKYGKVILEEFTIIALTATEQVLDLR
jgi:hypothetical protein